MAFRCPRCSSSCWGSGVGSNGKGVGVCHACTNHGIGAGGCGGGCGFTWQRSRANDIALGIEPVGLDGDGYVKCGTVNVRGFVKEQNLLRPAVKFPNGTVSVFIEEPWGGAWLPCYGNEKFISYNELPPTEAEAVMRRAGLGATVADIREQAVREAYPNRDVGGWDIWASDPNVEPIYQRLLKAAGLTDERRATMPTQSFPVWPIVAVGVVAVGIFVATLAIKPNQ